MSFTSAPSSFRSAIWRFVKRGIWLIAGRVKNREGVLYRFCREYILACSDFSYEPQINGEFYLLRQLSALEPRVVFDVGANTGMWSAHAATVLPMSDVHMFEVATPAATMLEQRFVGPRFRVNGIALSDRSGVLSFKDYGELSTVNTILPDAEFWDTTRSFVIRQARALTGDEYCSMNEIQFIDILKIDVEGAEHLVLGGFQRMLRAGNIRIIQFEYGFAQGDARFLMKDFYKFFDDYGYIVGKVCRAGVQLLPFAYELNQFDSGPNFVAIRASDAQLLATLSRAP